MGDDLKKVFLISLIFICFFSFDVVKADYSINAESYVLIEKDSLRVLDGKNINKQLLTASICKILTCIVAIEEGEIYKEYIVTEDVVKQIGSSIYLEAGEKIRLIDLLYGMMLRSGNDAAYMISKIVGGDVTEFVKMMNSKAKEIGMKYSIFSNPSGLDEDSYNYSTAYDMGILMAYCMNNETFCEITSSESYTYKTSKGINKTFINKHKLVRAYDFITGGKTGVGV